MSRHFWRKWWDFYKYYLLGWAIVQPLNFILYFPSWSWAIGSALGCLLVLWLCVRIADAFVGHR